MSGSRIRLIAIAVLALINAFFLAIIAIDNYADAVQERQALENACEVLQSNGIAINPGCVAAAGALRTMRTARSDSLEASIAGAFLGETEMADHGVIFLYENEEMGSAEFYSAGDFIINLREGAITDAGDALKTVRELLSGIQLETSAAVLRLESEGYIVAVNSSYDEASIFNCAIYFTFNEGSLRTVAGRYVAGIEPAEGGSGISYVGTALLGFLAAVKRGDFECKEILSVEAGFMHSVVGTAGEGVIAPIWLITTADGRYAVDSATGEVRQI